MDNRFSNININCWLEYSQSLFHNINITTQISVSFVNLESFSEAPKWKYNISNKHTGGLISINVKIILLIVSCHVHRIKLSKQV